MSFNMSDYIDVRQRVQLFHAKYPEGSLRFEFKGLCDHNPEYIWGIAYAYRTADDPAPAMGTAQELANGRTNFTRGSEIQNLETSAWGRCISALGLGIDKAIASADEVRYAEARQAQREHDEAQGYVSRDYHVGREPRATAKQIEFINKLVNKTTYVVEYWKQQEGHEGDLTVPQAKVLIEYLKDLDLAAKTRLFADAKKWHDAKAPADEYDPWALPTEGEI